MTAVSMTLAVVTIVGALQARAWAADGYTTFGGQWWSQSADEAKYQEFRYIPHGGLMESYLLQEWGGKTGFALWGSNALQKDQADRLTAERGMRWRLDLGYTAIPHDFSNIARWGWSQVRPGGFTVPDSLQAQNQNTNTNTFAARMQDFTGSAPVVGLDFNTHVSTARLRARPARGWQFEARGAIRNRSGMKPYGITFGSPGTGPLENPEPIDQRTVDADFIANYQKKDLRVQASGGVSVFDNAVSTLLVDNPRRVTNVSGGAGAKIGALDLYPDNQQIRGTVAVSYLLPRRSALAATLGMSQTTQDDKLLGFTTNTAIVTGTRSINDSLPAQSADAKAVSLNADVRLNSHLTNALTGMLRFKYDDYDNQTPEYQFLGRVPYDASLQRYIELHNKAYANTQWHTGVDLDYAFSRALKVGGTYEYRTRERTERESEKDKESVLSGRARWNPTDVVSVDARYWHGDRKLDEFDNGEYMGLTTQSVTPYPGVFDSLAQLEQPDLRRYDVANRVQDRAFAGVTYTVNERLDLGGNYTYRKSDYKDTKLGLQDETEQNVALDGTIHASDRLDLSGSYGFGLAESNQISRQSGSTMSSSTTDNWSANLKDTDVYVGAGAEWWARPEKLSLSADYEFSRHLQDFDLSNNFNPPAVDVPQTLYRRHDLTVDATYRWLRNMSLIGRYNWEEYDIVDFATNNVPLVFPVSSSAAITLGDSSQSYRAHRVAFLARWTF
jgi:MtrB/PioB family decaheme-associated outer membrane protein